MHRSAGKREKNKSAALQICAINFRKWRGNPRIYVLLVFLFYVSWITIGPVREYAMEQGMSISCWFYPALFQNNMHTIFYYFGVVLLFCNAPFIDEQQMYVLLRSGRRRWFLGEILYIMLASAIYFLVVFFTSMIEFMPYVGFSMKWEDLIIELAQNATVNEFNFVSLGIITRFTPLQAIGLLYFINVGIGIFLGLLIFYVNLWKSRGYGIAAAMFWLFLSEVVVAFSEYRILVYFSPLSWCDIERFCRNTNRMSISYVFSILILCGIILCGLILHKAKSYNIEAMEEI